MKVAFLLDKSNNWVEPFVINYIKENNDYIITFEHSLVLNFDIVFILGYTKILDEKFLSSNKLNLVVHESDLPKGKGFSPVQWQILEGKKEILFTLFEASQNIDAGDIVLQRKVKFTGYELFDEIRDIQGKETIKLIDEFLNIYPHFLKSKQVGKETIYPRKKDKDDMLDINKSIKEQFNHFRIANNDEYPLWFEIDGHRYILKIYKEKT